MKLKRRDPPKAKPLSSPVFSYYTTGREEASLQKKQQSFWLVPKVAHFWPRLGFGLLSLGLLTYLSYLTTNPIIRLPSGSPALRPASQYGDLAGQLLKGSVFNRNKLTLRSSAIAVKLKQQFPELSMVSVHTDLLGARPVIKLGYLQPSWRLLSADGRGWLISQEGVVLGPADGSLTIPAKLPIIEDKIGLQASAGKQLLAASDLKFMTYLSAYLSAKQISIERFILPLVPREVDVQLSGDKYVYKLNLNSTADWQAGSLLAARETLASSNSRPLAYVDLRASEKAFWK